jgi:hypothetical protein
MACSPVLLEEEEIRHNGRPLSSPVVALTPKNYDIIEIKQDLTNDEIITMQETYQ